MLLKSQIKIIEEEKAKAKSRCLISLCDSLLAGIEIDDLPLLMRKVELAYKTGKHRRPSLIFRNFKYTLNYLFQKIN